MSMSLAISPPLVSVEVVPDFLVPRLDQKVAPCLDLLMAMPMDLITGQ